MTGRTCDYDRTEPVLGWIAVVCAIYLPFGPVSDRTHCTRGDGSTIDAGIYSMAALFSGVVALVAFAVSAWWNRRVVLVVLGAAIAIAAFARTVYVCGIYVLARLQGEVYFYGTGGYWGDGSRRFYPAIGPFFFGTAALVGAIATLVVAVRWVWQARLR